MKPILIFLLLSIQSLAFAWPPAMYPVVTSSRIFGTNQGSVPSCAAHSEVTALEHAFAAKSLPIKFSSYYRHECNYKESNAAKRTEMCLQAVTPDDTCIYDKIGDFVPEYMFPEDNESNELIFASGMQPQAKKFGIFNGMPHLKDFGFKSEYFTFAKDKDGRDYANTRTVHQMLEEFSKGNAISLSLHGALFTTILNPKTGTLDTKYVKENFMKLATEFRQGGSSDAQNSDWTAINHGVALVGYDMNFYADHKYSHPGAIFVRNSWNSNSLREDVNSDSTPTQLVELNKFRLKFFSRNLPGYYAIPIQYLMDLEGQIST